MTPKVMKFHQLLMNIDINSLCFDGNNNYGSKYKNNKIYFIPPVFSYG